jgi:hypothetical protein
MHAQFIPYTIASGATSGSITATSLSRIIHIVMGDSSGLINTAAPTYSGNAATLAFTVPTSTAATRVTQGLTLTAVATDNTGNLISIRFTGGATAGAEVVTVVGNAITVQVESGVSTVTQVRTAMQAEAACTALVTTTGTDTATVATASALLLTGGITGGTAGTAFCIGN